MRTSIVLGSALVLALGMFAARPLWSEEGSDEGGEGLPEWMVAGPEHKKLAEVAGEWTVESELYMGGPDAQKSTGTATFEVILDGKFVKQTYKGEMAGMAFEGVGIDGYDRVLGKYTFFWCDSMGTSPLSGTGTSKDGGKTIEYHAEMMDPESKKPMKIRMLHTGAGKDRFTFEMFGEHDGKEILMFKLTYNRKK
ncbi:MAG: DUF1579 family protein [Candidatus Brocadiae bacterium]|nr:DUF1579 family protein [Candidatus Brocadiia bacterium]